MSVLAEVVNPTGLRLTKSDTDGVWLHFDIAGKKGGGIRLDDGPCFPSKMKWAEHQFEIAAEAKAPTVETQETSSLRPQLDANDFNLTFTQLQKKVQDRLNEKGNGIIISRHEMLGIIAEEYNELLRAVESGNLFIDVEDELVDITVAGIVSIASLKTGGVQW